MLISSTPIPSTARVAITPQALADNALFCRYVAAIIATWADVEARLEAIFVQVAGASYPSQLSAFRELKGWDRRTKEIVRVAKLQWPIQQVDEVKAVLRELVNAAGKRHELAHGVWGEMDGRSDVIALFPEGVFTDIAIRTVEAESAGTTAIDARVQEPLSRGCLVGMGDLESLREDVVRARELVHAYQLKLMPFQFDLTGQRFADQARKVSENPGVAERMLNAARSRKADET